MKAFISSTFTDLEQHRAHVIASLRRAGIVVDPMEEWTAESDEPRKFCSDRMKGADLCILLVARRRGHIPEGEIKSITQLEYAAALENGTDVLVFLLAEDALWRRQWDDLDKDEDLRQWRAELASRHGVEFFYHDPATLDILPAISRWIGSRKVRSSQSARSFQAEWFLFAPFCPGIAPPASEPIPGFTRITSDADSCMFLSESDPGITLRWFNCGAAVWTLRTVNTFENLSRLAAERQVAYYRVLKGDHACPYLTGQINTMAARRSSEITPFQQPIGYALSMFSVIESSWQDDQRARALQIMACPNILLEVDCTEDDGEVWVQDGAAMLASLAKEESLLCQGVPGGDLKEFAQPGLVQGYACWAGVATHIAESIRAKMVSAYVAFQEQLQALWWRVHSLECIWEEQGTADHVTHLWEPLSRLVYKTLRIGPREVTALRLFKEAVITTSRIESVFDECRQTLRKVREP